MLDVLLQPVGIVHYFLLSTLLFVIGATGIFLNRRHVLSMLMALELMARIKQALDPLNTLNPGRVVTREALLGRKL